MKTSFALASIMGALASISANTVLPTIGESPKVSHDERPVGAGFYAYRHNVSAGGVHYTKLVAINRGRNLTRKEIKANSRLLREEAKKH